MYLEFILYEALRFSLLLRKGKDKKCWQKKSKSTVDIQSLSWHKASRWKPQNKASATVSFLLLCHWSPFPRYLIPTYRKRDNYVFKLWIRSIRIYSPQKAQPGSLLITHKTPGETLWVSQLPIQQFLSLLLINNWSSIYIFQACWNTQSRLTTHSKLLPCY